MQYPGYNIFNHTSKSTCNIQYSKIERIIIVCQLYIRKQHRVIKRKEYVIFSVMLQIMAINIWYSMKSYISEVKSLFYFHLFIVLLFFRTIAVKFPSVCTVPTILSSFILDVVLLSCGYILMENEFYISFRN